MGKQIMKHINSELPVFMNVNSDAVFQILGDDRWASKLRFIVHVPPPLKR
jgi:hypothetical protein